jgi:Zn-dependent protease
MRSAASTGSLTIGTIGRSRIPIRVHWSAPLGAFIFTGCVFAPARWLAFLVLILAHELGHAAMVRLARAQVLSIEVNGVGGQCRWTGYASRFQRAYIASGGVLAQALVFVATLVMLAFSLHPFGRHTGDVVDTFLRTNLILAAVNLLPIAPLDGAEAWAVVPLLVKQARGSWLALRLHRLQRRRRFRSVEDQGPSDRWMN